MSTHSFKSCPVSLHHYQPTSISPSLFSLFTTTTYNIPQNISKSNMFSLYCLTYFPTQLDSAIDLCSSSWLPISLFHPQQHQKLRDSFQSTLVDSLQLTSRTTQQDTGPPQLKLPPPHSFQLTPETQLLRQSLVRYHDFDDFFNVHLHLNLKNSLAGRYGPVCNDFKKKSFYNLLNLDRQKYVQYFRMKCPPRNNTTLSAKIHSFILVKHKVQNLKRNHG